MKFLFALLLTCGACFGQITFEIIPSDKQAGSSGVTEFADVFTTASDTDLTNHVTTTGGYAWKRIGGVFTNSASLSVAVDYSTSSGIYYVNHTISSANYTVQAVVSYPNHTDTVEADLGGRSNTGVSANNTCYFVSWNSLGQNCQLYKVISGGVTTLGSPLATTGTSQTLKLTFSGTTISAYCNGTLVASVTDSAIAGPGLVVIGPGIRSVRPGFVGSNHFTYSNLLVTVP